MIINGFFYFQHISSIKKALKINYNPEGSVHESASMELIINLAKANFIVSLEEKNPRLPRQPVGIFDRRRLCVCTSRACLSSKILVKISVLFCFSSASVKPVPILTASVCSSAILFNPSHIQYDESREKVFSFRYPGIMTH